MKIVIPVGLALVAGVAYLAFGVFAIQTLFVDDKVDEAEPVFDSGVGAEVATDVAVVDTTEPAEIPADDSDEEPTEIPAPLSTCPL